MACRILSRKCDNVLFFIGDIGSDDLQGNYNTVENTEGRKRVKDHEHLVKKRKKKEYQILWSDSPHENAGQNSLSKHGSPYQTDFLQADHKDDLSDTSIEKVEKKDVIEISYGGLSNLIAQPW